MSRLDHEVAEQKKNLNEVMRRMISLKSDRHSNEKQTEQNFENIEDLRQGRADTNKRIDALEKKMEENAAATSERLRALEDPTYMRRRILILSFLFGDL